MVAVPAVKVELQTYSNAVARTCASGNQISGGNLMVLSEPNTVASSALTTIGGIFGGIAASEKSITNGDTSTTLACHMDGVWDITAGTVAVTMGAAVMMSGANQIVNATEAVIAAGGHVGWAEETGSAAEVIRVRLRGSGM